MSHKNTICLVDDDEIFQYLTEKNLEETKLAPQIKKFSNGFEAINFLKAEINNPEHLPEIIILDLFMPIMNGWEFMEEYILLQPQLTKKIVIYIVSSSVAPADVQKAKSITAVTDFISKPISQKKLIEIMENLSNF